MDHGQSILSLVLGWSKKIVHTLIKSLFLAVPCHDDVFFDRSDFLKRLQDPFENYYYSLHTR
jgi:hypothetical protein